LQIVKLAIVIAKFYLDALDTRAFAPRYTYIFILISNNN